MIPLLEDLRTAAPATTQPGNQHRALEKQLRTRNIIALVKARNNICEVYITALVKARALAT